MICPLRGYSYTGEYNQQQREEPNCLKEECAWWVEERKKCALLAISTDLDHIEQHSRET